jgi:hypothetical protein
MEKGLVGEEVEVLKVAHVVEDLLVAQKVVEDFLDHPVIIEQIIMEGIV